MRRRPHALLFFLSVLLTQTALRAQEWPRFRGPNGSGVASAEAPGVPARWSDADYDWKVKLPGGGHSSPVLWGDKLFVTSADDDSARRHVLCLGAADGSVLWHRQFDSRNFRQHGDNSYASATPAADELHVYVPWATPESLVLMAFDHAGRDAWKLDLGPFVSQHGGGASPVVFDDLVILGNDQEGRESFLVAVDRKTGKVRWKAPRTTTRFSASTPCVWQPEGPAGPAQIVFTSRSHGFTGVDPKTGKVAWEVPGAFDSRTVGSPVVGGEAGLIFATCGEGPRGHGVVAVRPRSADGATPAAVAYKTPGDDTPYVPTPLASGGLLFYWSDTGTVTCARAATGQTVWRERLRGGGGYYASPVCVNGRLYNVSRKGEVTCLSASEKFEVLGKSDLGEKCHATPAVARGRMFLRTYSHVMSVGGKAKG